MVLSLHKGAEDMNQSRNRSSDGTVVEGSPDKELSSGHKIFVLRRLIAVLSLALLLMAACTKADPPEESPSPPSTPTPTGPASYGGPDTPRLDWSEVWELDRKGLEAVDAVRRIGSRLVLWGTTTNGKSTIMVVDAGSGKLLWDDGDLPARLSTKLGPIGSTSDEGWAAQRLAMAADDGRGGVLILDYYRSRCPTDEPMCHSRKEQRAGGVGLIAVSLVDRSVRWATEITPAVKRLGGINQAVRMDAVGANESVIATRTYSSGIPSRDLGLATVAIDPRTGQRLWRAEQVLPARVEGDRVLALKAPTGDDRWEAVGTPVVLDGRTGAKISSVAVKKPAFWNDVGDGLATIFTADDAEAKIPVIELSDGRVVLELPASAWQEPQVSESSSGPVAWWYEGSNLFTQSVGDPAPLLAPPPASDEPGTLLFAHGDHVWVEKPQGQLAYDRSGRASSDLVSGTVLQVDDELILVVRPDGGLRLLRLT